MASYRISPENISDLPPGIRYIIGNEFAERFSYYGMRAILYVFMTQYLLGTNGELSVMGEEEATKWQHLFMGFVYVTPFLGAILADCFIGKYKTIIWLSLIYCLGHVALAIDETRIGLAIGLGLIALGSGGIKPCVSAHVGDQFGSGNSRLLSQVFSWFYLSINLGAMISSLLIPKLLEWYGPHVAFGVPGLLMLLATFVFWLGRHKFVHIQPDRKGMLEDILKPGVIPNLLKLIVIYIFFVAMFWMVFDQTASRWVGQAEDMDRIILVVEFSASQIQAINPILVLILIPIFNYGIYPTVGKFIKITALGKMSAGFFIAAISFMIPALVENWIEGGQQPSIWWQILAYALITSAEILISITCLEFSYTQAPKRLKSMVMAMFLVSVFAGNMYVALINGLIEAGKLPFDLSGPNYYWFFTACVFVTGVLFVILSRFYKERSYLQSDKT